TDVHVGALHTGKRGDRLQDPLLSRVGRLEIALRIGADQLSESQHACVLAGTVAMHGPWLFAPLGKRLRRRPMQWRMGAAPQVRFVVPDILEDMFHLLYVKGFAVMRGAHDSDVR